MSDYSVQLYPHLVQPQSVGPRAAEWGQLTVPENRSAKESRLITIPFVRFRCTGDSPGSPLVFLQGGPGTSALSYLPLMWNKPVMKPPVELADCIFIDHRGFGLSRPSLDCPGAYHVPLDEPGSARLYMEAHRQYLIEAVSFWHEQGIDIDGYNAREMAGDINDLRRALGYEKLSLYGGSFGSHHGFALLHYFGETIERAFLWDIEGPNHTIKLPSNIQHQLQTLDSFVKADPDLYKLVPDLLELIASLLDRLAQPVTVEVVHPQLEKKVAVTIGTYDLQLITANGLGNVPFLRSLPLRYLDMANGDYSWLAEQVIRERVNLQSNLMYEATDLASGATEERRQLIARETGAALLGNAINEPFHELGDVVGNQDLGDEFRGRLVSDVPIVLVSGSLDARTPISNAEELLPDLKNGQLIRVKGASHDIAVRGSHCEDMALCRDQFLRGEEVGVRQLDAGFTFQYRKGENQ